MRVRPLTKTVAVTYAFCLVAWLLVGVVRGATPEKQIVRVSTPEHGRVTWGSGVVVDLVPGRSFVLTNHHIVKDGPESFVYVPNGAVYATKRLGSHPLWDVALLEVKQLPFLGVDLEHEPMHIGDTIWIAGYGRGDFRVAPSSIIQAVAPSSGSPFELLEVSAQARQGDSGGPMITSNGRIGGILSAAGNGRTVGTYSPRLMRLCQLWVPAYSQSCPTNNCPQQTSPPRVVRVKPRPAPSAPRLTPGSGRGGTEAPRPSAGLSDADITKLLDRMAKDSRFKPKHGTDGKDGESPPDPDPAVLAKQIQPHLPPIRFVFPSGEHRDVHLSEQLPLKMPGRLVGQQP